MICLREVTYSISQGRFQVDVLRNVSVDLPSNERLAILALQGAGKTSLIKLLAGAILPQEGVIDRYAKVSFPVGFGGGFRVKISLRENIAHVARLYGADVDEILDFVGTVADTSDAMHTKLGEISPQLRVRLSYALSYAIPFDTYLIDGRIAVGDDLFRARCEQMFESRSESCGIILTTGFSRYARRYCNRIAILNGGDLVLYDDFDKGCWDFDKLVADGSRAMTADQG